ncbi:MAG TPA: hypothetical protein VFU14_16930 [Acidimicrobiales bacterium]|nr:hypothetical protein [Acidimicrobiales bacterium]
MTAAPASAAPPGPPDYGVVEPSGISDKGCPWPDVVNEEPEHADAQKCLPQSIPWSGNFHPEDALLPTYGVRIISDALTGTTGTGQFTFRCQSRVGLQYKVTVQGLTPRTEYTVEVLHLGPQPMTHVLGTFTTDQSGNGILNGILQLDGGGYGFLVFVKDVGGATVLSLAPELLPGGGSEPGVVGLAVLDDPASPEYRA